MSCFSVSIFLEHICIIYCKPEHRLNMKFLALLITAIIIIISFAVMTDGWRITLRPSKCKDYCNNKGYKRYLFVATSCSCYN
ncbi:hypothetical protein EB796_020776 [Bugula neritina]|uniref:Uncharacterized protein n=1 Tax=Bugula neritina TaxID=10212 RepID=A0A7J7J4D9_BUGNE|nr:hypothetical protein EB796_020776 [Bugula neritina]